jgi:RimJ/RimL family protein N-acetyltransferase
MKGKLSSDEGEEHTNRVFYAVHKVLESTTSTAESAGNQGTLSTEFIGLVTLRSLDARSLALPKGVTLPITHPATTLTVELGYMFLPTGWGKGYATESVGAVLESCKRARGFWAPFSSLYIRAVVNQGNPASMKVMDKVGLAKTGVYEWTGRLFYGGEWRERDSVNIYGIQLPV